MCLRLKSVDRPTRSGEVYSERVSGGQQAERREKAMRARHGVVMVEDEGAIVDLREECCAARAVWVGGRGTEA
jgi:hypothetical protein